MIFGCLTFFACNAGSVILDTKQGRIKGEILQSRGGRPFYAFYNVPYAQPPVGELRFEVSETSLIFFKHVGSLCWF